MRIVGFPGVVGAINGTHVHILPPTVNEDIPIENKASVIICANFTQCKAFKKIHLNIKIFQARFHKRGLA